MGSEILQYTRDRFPNLADVPDNELTMYVGDRFPDLLEKDSQFKSEYEQYKRANTSAAADFGESFVKGLVFDTPAALASTGEALLKTVNSEYAKSAKEFADWVSAEGDAYAEEVGINPDSWASAFGGGAASLVPIFATGGTLGALGAGAKAAQIGVYGMTALQSFGGTYKQARDAYVAKGLSEDEAHTNALIPAISSAVLEVGAAKVGGALARKYGVDDIEGLAATLRTPPAKKAIGKVLDAANQSVSKTAVKIAGGAAIEGGEEAAVAIGDSIASVLTYAPELTLEEATNAVVKSFVVGAGLGGAIGGGRELLGRRRTAKQIAEVERIRKVAPLAAEKIEQRQYQSASSILPDDGQSVLESTQTEEKKPTSKADEVTQRIESEGIKPAWWSMLEDIRFADQATVDEFVEKFIPDFEAQEAANQFEVTSIDYEGEPVGFEVSRNGKSLAEFNTREEADAYVAKAAIEVAPAAIKQRISDYQDLARSVLDISKAESVIASPQSAPTAEATASQISQVTGIPVEDIPYANVSMAADAFENDQVIQRINEEGDTRWANRQVAARAADASRRRREARQVERERASETLSDATAKALSLVDSLKNRRNPIPQDQPDPVKVDDPAEKPVTTDVATTDTAEPAPVTLERDEVPAVQQSSQLPSPPKKEIKVSSSNKLGSTSVELVGELSGELQSKLTTALKQAQKSLGTLAWLNQVVVRKLPGTAGVASAARAGQFKTIYVDPERLAKAVSVKKFSLAKAIEEEVIHNLDGWALERAWLRSKQDGTLPPRQTLTRFIEEHYKSIAESMTQKERTEARKTYGQDFQNDAHMAQEFVRMLVQKKLTKQTTEQAYRNPLIQRLLRVLRYIFTDEVGRGTRVGSANIVKSHLADLDAFIAKIKEAERADSISAREKQKAAQPEPDAKAEYEDLQLTPEQERIMDEALVQAYTPDASGLNKFQRSVESRIKQRNAAWIDARVRDNLADEVLQKFAKYLGEGKDPKKFAFSTVADGLVIREIRARDSKKTRSDGKNTELVSADVTTQTSEGSDLQMQIEDRTTNQSEVDAAEQYLAEVRDRISALIANPVVAEEAGFEGENAVRDLQLTLDAKLYRVKGRELADKYGVSEGRISQIVSDHWTELFSYISNRESDLSQAMLDLNEAMIKIRDVSNNPFLAGASMPEMLNLTAAMMRGAINLKTGIWKFFNSGLKILDPIDPNNLSKHINLHSAKIESDAYTNSALKQVDFTSRKLAKAMKQAFPDLSDQTMRALDLALKGNRSARNNMPENVLEVVDDMRQQIDDLTRYMKAKGWLTGDLLVKVDQNMGTYVARSYRLFDEENWKTNIPDDVKNRATNLIETQLRREGLGEADVQVKAKKILESYIDYIRDVETPSGDMKRGSRVGQKNLSLFKKRNEDLPEALRVLMGEYENPIVNYAKSVQRMASFIGNQMFLEKALAEGKGRIFFNKDDEMRLQAGATNQIKGALPSKRTPEQATTRNSYSPLAGYYTTPTVEAILTEYGNQQNILFGSLDNPIWNAMVRANAYTKYAKTLLSLMGDARNLIGQVPMMMANGHNPVRLAMNWKKIKLVFNDAFGTDSKMEEYYLKLTRLGLTGEDASVAEFKKVMGAFGKMTAEHDSYESFWVNGVAAKLHRALRGSKKLASTLWRSSDELGKIIGFENEKILLRQLPTYADWSDAQIEQEAAKRVRAGYATYSEIPLNIQKFSTQPLIGPFSRFFYEMFRTSVNSLKIARDEIANGNIAYGARRIAGFLAVTAGSAEALRMLSGLLGVDDDEQDAARELMAPWEKRKQHLFFRDSFLGIDGAGKGEVKYINLGFNNPYSAIADPILTLFGRAGLPSDEEIEGQILEALNEFAKPFAEPGISTQMLMGLRFNEDAYGNKIWNEEASAASKNYDKLKFIGKQFAPGTLDRAVNRMLPAYLGKEIKSGEVPELKQEILNELAGFKVKTLDYQQQLKRIAPRNRSRIYEANRNFNSEAASKASVSTESLIDAYREANDSRKRVFRDINRQVRAARLGGMTDAEIIRALKNGNISRQDIKYIMSGKLRAMQVTPEIAKTAKQEGHPIPMQVIKQIAREYNGTPINEQDE